MKSFIKWLVIAGCVFLLVVGSAVFLAPKFINVNKYKPVIEDRIAAVTGRSFSLGDDIDLSVFPWVGLKLTDIHLGNPKGFMHKDLVSIKKFEIRLRFMPLLSKRVEIKTFVIDQPEIYLEKRKDGTAGWQGMGSSGEKTMKKKKAGPSESRDSGMDQALPVNALEVKQCTITNGRLIYQDDSAGIKKEISGLNITLKNISLDTPINISAEADIDGRPVSFRGMAGPLGKEPGKEDLALDFSISVFKQLKIGLKGKLTDPGTKPGYDFKMDVPLFSPVNLVSALGWKLPFKTADPDVLNKLSLKAVVKGTQDHVSITGGHLVLDDSTIDFTASAKAFSKPDLKFDFNMDKMDLDRYLPESSSEKKPESRPENRDKPSGNTAGEPGSSPGKKIDYTPLRKLVLDGKIKAGKLKIHGIRLEKIKINIMAKNGIIRIDPADVRLYQGKFGSSCRVDVRKDIPATSVKLDIAGVRAGRLIRDAMQKNLIEGRLDTIAELTMKGIDPEMIKHSITGHGRLTFTDGAIIGIDLADTVRSIKSVFGAGEKSGSKPKTDFAEFVIPFTASKGLVNINGTRLVSPLIRVSASGTTDLGKSLLNLRVAPKLVATLKGQGDTQEHKGLTIPVSIKGPFSSPAVRPDLKSMFKTGQGLDVKALKKNIPAPDSIDTKNIKDQVKGLFKGFLN